ncbi:MAG TPA: hypothetical protein PLX89_04670 [Verrucomicrobiota bacterium]|nr:hypothetical protein [Verrucomicrobiota bacterium]
MNPIAIVESTVTRTASRLRWLRGWVGFWKGALAGAALYLFALALFKVAPISPDWVRWAGWIGLALPIAGCLWGLRRRATSAEAARWLDERQGLQQRLSTALEFSPRSETDPWRDLVVADASAAAANVDASKLLPWGLPRIARAVALLLALTVTLGFLPAYRTKAQVQQSKDAAVIKEVGRELAALSKRSMEQRPALAEPARKNLEDVHELGQRLGQVKLTRDDALKDLAKATDQLRQQATDLARNPTLRKMAKAARTPGGSAPQNQSQLQKQMEALQKQLGDKAPTDEAAKELKKDLDQLKDAAKAMADNASADSRAAQQEQLQNMANELAKKAEALGLPMPSLDEAVAALKGAQVDQFLKDLEIAEKDLEKMADLSRQMAQLQQQAEKLGKDLAEQLKNGQAQAAIESLRQMQELVKKTELTDAQKQQLAKEVQEAIKPGEQYGEVGEHLRQALARLQSGNPSGTQQALAAAQSELEKLLNEMGDLQALMATMEGLKKAQMCVGNCQGWGSKSGGAGGKSGKPKGNRGFGDWADDSSWAMPDEIADAWDNSGLERKDKDGRGISDRDSSVPDNVATTKLKGQIQPGGPMPSITLKGLSIKGESKVAYAEAVQSAQSDAQAALSQEQVPKAYRNSVRDYFDDLKK